MAEVGVCQSEARFELLLCNLHPVFCFSIVNHHPLRLGGCPIPGWAPTIPGVATWISLREGLAIPLKLIHCKVESVLTLWEMLSCLEPRIQLFPKRIMPRTTPSECTLQRPSYKNPCTFDEAIRFTKGQGKEDPSSLKLVPIVNLKDH